jgi:drug/metabolite transporter (DMT)-like permease
VNIVGRQSGKLGYFYVALAAVLFAVSGTSAKFLFHSGITPYQLIQLRTTLAFTCLLIWLCLRHSALLKISISDLPYFLALGVLGIGAAQFLYLFAISKINVAAAILLHYTGPVFVALYVVFVQRQKIGVISILAICGTLAGCYLVVGAYNLQLLALNRIGIISGLLAAVAFAIYSVLSEYGMRKYTPWTVLLYGMRCNGAGFCLLVFSEPFCPSVFISKASKKYDPPLPVLQQPWNRYRPVSLQAFFWVKSWDRCRSLAGLS